MANQMNQFDKHFTYLKEALVEMHEKNKIGKAKQESEVQMRFDRLDTKFEQMQNILKINNTGNKGL
jgi:hypothetical protein